MTEEGRVYCRMIKVPPRRFPTGFPGQVARIILQMQQKWVPGTVIKYCFLDQPSDFAGGDKVKNIAREGFKAWKDVGVNLTFEEVSDPADAQMRVGFKKNDGYWSYVGREILNTHYNCTKCPAAGFPSDKTSPRCPNCGSLDLEREPRTMNLDGANLAIDSRGKDVPCHEMGHTLGLPHEHQSPFAGIEWNKQAVYDEFRGYPNYWPPEVVDWNILEKHSKSEVEGSEWDPNSIMEYEFGPGLIISPEQYKSGVHPAGGISPKDQKWIQYWYPPGKTAEEIKLNQPIELNIKQGEGKEFYFIAPETREYDFQTFGESDTVIVLFEEINGKRNQLDADDDSAGNWNAHIRYELKKGNKYVLSIRLYWDWAGGVTTVKVW